MARVSDVEVLELLAAAGVPVPRFARAGSAKEAGRAAGAARPTSAIILV